MNISNATKQYQSAGVNLTKSGDITMTFPRAELCCGDSIIAEIVGNCFYLEKTM